VTINPRKGTMNHRYQNSFLRYATLLFAVVVVTITSVGGLTASRASAAAAPVTGWLRVAHLSPDTPSIDVYLSSFDGKTVPFVLHGVHYGDVSTYRSVPAGTYTAAMRLAGASAAAAPMLSATATVASGRAYTVAVVGVRAAITARVLSDDLTPPKTGSARIRLIQGSTLAPVVNVRAVSGPVVASDVRFATSTGYATVPAGRWTLQVTPKTGSAQPTVMTVDMTAGSVNTLLVLDNSNQTGLALKLIVDSQGAAIMPTGGVDTGFGPVQATPGLSGRAFPTLALSLFVVLAAVAARWTHCKTRQVTG
jgi:hypothetical protein